MILYIFENILHQIKIGGRPPTVVYRITKQQYDAFCRAIDRNIDEEKVDAEIEKWATYKDTWRLKLRPSDAMDVEN